MSDEKFTGVMHAHGGEIHEFKNNKERDRMLGCVDLIQQHLSNAQNSLTSGFGVMYDKKPETLAEILGAVMGHPVEGANALGFIGCRGCIAETIHQFEEIVTVLRDLQAMFPPKKETA